MRELLILRHRSVALTEQRQLQIRNTNQANAPKAFGAEKSPIMTTSKKSMLVSTFATLLTLVVLARPSAAQSYNAATDFSAVSNPNGAWSYGYTSTLGSAFILDTTNTASYLGTALSGWEGFTSSDGIPYVLKNGSGSPVTLVNTTYAPGQLAEHPGKQGQYVDVRWTAPFSGTFSLAATFSGLSSLGDSVDVHILHNGVSIFNSTVFGSPSPTSYSGLQGIVAGDTIDFVAGFGSDGNYDDDTTGLSASIVPEPGTLGLVGMGLGCLLSFCFWKRK